MVSMSSPIDMLISWNVLIILWQQFTVLTKWQVLTVEFLGWTKLELSFQMKYKCSKYSFVEFILAGHVCTRYYIFRIDWIRIGSYQYLYNIGQNMNWMNLLLKSLELLLGQLTCYKIDEKVTTCELLS